MIYLLDCDIGLALLKHLFDDFFSIECEPKCSCYENKSLLGSKE